jgi:transcriptional antiterminator
LFFLDRFPKTDSTLAGPDKEEQSMIMTKSLKILFLINAVFSGVGAIVLFFGTGILNSLTGLSSEANFVWYLLGVCSLSLAFLSFFAAKFKEKIAVRVAAAVFMIFHFLSAVVSVIVVADGMNHAIIGNTFVHLLFLTLFIIFGKNLLNFRKR